MENFFRSLASSLDNFEQLNLIYFLTHNILRNVVVVVVFFLSIWFISGFFVRRQIIKDKTLKVFKNHSMTYDFMYGYFLFVNSIFDWIYCYMLNPLASVLDKFLSKFWSDEKVNNFLLKLFKKDNYLLRWDEVNKDFSQDKDAFLFASEVADDLRVSSIVIQNKMFNGKPLKEYLSMFLDENNLAQAFRRSLIIFGLSFVLLSVLFTPNAIMGYNPNRVYDENIQAVEAQMLLGNNKSSNATVDNTDWQLDDSTTTSDEQDKELFNKAKSYVDNNTGYSGISTILQGGYLTALIFALAIALSYLELTLQKIFKSFRLNYIENMPEETLDKEDEISHYKRNLSTQNARATSWDRDSLMFKLGQSTQLLEERGYIGAQRAGQDVQFSSLDAAQNTIVGGETGSGKTILIFFMFAEQLFDARNKTQADNERYEQFFDQDKAKPRGEFDDEGNWSGLVNVYDYEPIKAPKNTISTFVTDVKAQLWKDLYENANRYFLNKSFLIFGARDGEYAVDLLASIDPLMLKAFFNSLDTQMGGDGKKDFWTKAGSTWVYHFGNVAYLFHRTPQGELYAKKKLVKPWSLLFIYTLVNVDDNTLLMYCIESIMNTIKNEPERIIDILSTDRMDSLTMLLTKWQSLRFDAKETALGLESNMAELLASYNNDLLRSFITGVGDNIIEISQCWGKLSAINLDSTTYSTLGILTIKFLKVLLFGEAISRQQRFSSRMIEITREFIKHYPDMTTKTAIASLPINWFRGSSQKQILSYYLTFVNGCFDIAQARGEDWHVEDFETNLEAFINNNEKVLSMDTSKLSSIDLEEVRKLRAQLEIAYKAKKASEDFLNDPLNHHYLSTPTSITKFNAKEWLKTSPEDKSAAAQLKRRHMVMYYEYVDLSTKLKREHMFFLGDEYQALISIDKDGILFTDGNFPNVCRSANCKYFVATQTFQALHNVLGKEDAENFINQMRNILLLSNSDKITHDAIQSIVRKSDILQKGENGKNLRIDNKTSDYIIYNNYNSFRSLAVLKNRENGFGSVKAYPYTYDVFSTDIKPIKVDLDSLFGAAPKHLSAFEKFKYKLLQKNAHERLTYTQRIKQTIKDNSVFSNTFDYTENYGDTVVDRFDEKVLGVPNFVDHFMNTANIADFVKTGSSGSDQGVQSNDADIAKAYHEEYEKARQKAVESAEVDKDKPYYTINDYQEQGSSRIFYSIKRAGVTVYGQSEFNKFHRYHNKVV